VSGRQLSAPGTWPGHRRTAILSANLGYLIAAVFGTVSGLSGYLLAGRNEQKRDDRMAARDRQALRDRRMDDARVFQRDTLLELHDTLYKLNRVVGRTNHLDEMHYRQTGRYGRDPILPEDLDEKFTELLATVNRLRVRVFDEELRGLIGQYRESLIRGGLHGRRTEGDDAETRARAKREEKKSLDLYGRLEEKLGAMIRAQFPEK
jgi:hypothetical protein